MCNIKSTILTIWKVVEYIHIVGQANPQNSLHLAKRKLWTRETACPSPVPAAPGNHRSGFCHYDLTTPVPHTGTITPVIGLSTKSEHCIDVFETVLVDKLFEPRI